MYRKSMKEALAEARAYRDPIDEAKLPRQLKDPKKEYMVSKGGRVIVIDKSDWPMYKTKGWSLAEGRMKDVALDLNQLSDKEFQVKYGKSKDELKKSLEAIELEELDESLEVKWDANKQGWFDKQGRRRYLGKLATTNLMRKAIDKAKASGDWVKSFDLKHGQKPEETELKEGYENNMVTHLGELGIDVSFRLGKMIVHKSDLQRVKDALKDGIADRSSVIAYHRMPQIKVMGEEVKEAKTAGGALAQGHLETMTDQRFKEFYGMTKDEYIKKHGDPRKEETELTEALNINIVKGMTQRNDHFGARLYIAEQMKDKHMIAIYQGLGLAHDNYNRYVGNSALTVRQKLETVLKGKIVGTYGSAKGAEIIKAL